MFDRASAPLPRALALALLGAAPLACDDPDTVSPPEDATTYQDGALTPDGASFDAPGDALGDALGDQPVASLREGQVMGVLETVSNGEIAQGQLAVSLASDERVREYAAEMVLSHASALGRLRALSDSAGTFTEESELGRTLQRDAEATRQALSSLREAAFDDAYLDAQVLQHTQTLEVIDQVLLPSAALPELRAAIAEDVRPMVTRHLQRGRELQSTVGVP